MSSWEPEPKSKKARAPAEDARFPPDVQVKKGYTWSEQLAIAMAALQENGDGGLIEWVKDVCPMTQPTRKCDRPDSPPLTRSDTLHGHRAPSTSHRRHRRRRTGPERCRGGYGRRGAQGQAVGQGPLERGPLEDDGLRCAALLQPGRKVRLGTQLADRRAARGYFQRYPTSAMSKQTQRRRTRS